MKARLNGQIWRGVAAGVGVLLLAAACADEPVAPREVEREEGLREAPTLDALLTCTVDVVAGSMGCDPYAGSSSSAAAGPLSASLIVGNQHQFVRMANDAPVMAGGVWSANVTVQNLTLQPFATADGATADPVGVRVFFVHEPNNGVEVSNHDGVSAFTGSAPQKYYAYSGAELGEDGLLSPGEVSGAKRWEFELNGATAFQFSVLVSTVVPDPSGYGVHLTRVVAGGSHTCGEGSDGKAYCWGSNSFTQVGDSSWFNRLTPAFVRGIPAGVTLSGVAAGREHSCAEGSNGAAYCWGNHTQGRLGDGDPEFGLTPVEVDAPVGVTLTGLSAGFAHTCAEGSDGKAYCWGLNALGQLGDGTHDRRDSPVDVQAPTGVTLSKLTAGNSHTCAEGSDGKLYCWGNNSNLQLGDGSGSGSPTPVPVQEPVGVTLSSVVAGSFHTCAEGSDGKAYCWGLNDSGQVGDGTKTSRAAPVPVQVAEGIVLTGLAPGLAHTCAEGSDDKVYCWGNNDDGQLGDGTTAERLTPVPVQVPDGVTLSGLTAGDFHTCASGSDGKTYCWGLNDTGPVGDGTTAQRVAPVVVAGTRAP